MSFINLAAGDGFFPELHPAPYSIATGKLLLAIGGGLAGLLLLICLIQSLRIRRLRYSLIGLFAFCLALSLAVWGAVNWHQAKALARSEHWAFVIDGDLIRTADIEAEMGEIYSELTQFKREKTAAGLWNADLDSEWDGLYAERFKAAVQKMAFDCQALKQARRDGIQADFENVSEYVAKLKSANPVRSDQALRESIVRTLQAREFLEKLHDTAPPPTASEIEQNYKEHAEQFRRKAAYKFRSIILGGFAPRPLAGNAGLRVKLEALREDLVAGKIAFATAATQVNDGEFHRKNAGLSSNEPDGFDEEGDLSKDFKENTGDLKVGEVSPVLRCGYGYAIFFFEAFRASHIAPLEGAVLETITANVRDQKRLKAVDDWLRAALIRAKPAQFIEGEPQPMPIEYFFPEK